MNIPILSFLNTFYLTLPMLDKDKYNINYNFLSKNFNNILIISLILILSICIELEMGKLFILLMIFINLLMNNNLTDKLNLKEVLDNNFFYFLGVFLIVQIYLLRNNYIRGFLIFIILSILVMLEIQKYKIPNQLNNNTNNDKSNLKNFLLSSLMTIIILSWGHYGKEPNVKYVKLFYKK